jgi:hypothetical protein
LELLAKTALFDPSIQRKWTFVPIERFSQRLCTIFEQGRSLRRSEINFWTRISALQLPHHLHGGAFAPFWDADCYHDLLALFLKHRCDNSISTRLSATFDSGKAENEYPPI